MKLIGNFDHTNMKDSEILDIFPSLPMNMSKDMSNAILVIIRLLALRINMKKKSNSVDLMKNLHVAGIAWQ